MLEVTNADDPSFQVLLVLIWCGILSLIPIKKNKLLIWAALVLSASYCALRGLSPQANNYYSALGVTRGASVTDIRKAYRTMSKVHHPDKVDGNQSEFLRLKDIYDTLMEEDQRNVYNNFGPNVTQDPRKDEVQLIFSLIATASLWVALGYLISYPVAARRSRQWMYALIILQMILKVSVYFSDMNLPTGKISTVTEFEILFFVDQMVPMLLLLLRALSELWFVDRHQFVLEMMSELMQHHRDLQALLDPKSFSIVMPPPAADLAADVTPTTAAAEGIAGLSDEQLLLAQEHCKLALQKSERSVKALVEASKKSQSSFYLLVIVAIYGGFYLLQ